MLYKVRIVADVLIDRDGRILKQLAPVINHPATISCSSRAKDCCALVFARSLTRPGHNALMRDACAILGDGCANPTRSGGEECRILAEAIMRAEAEVALLNSAFNVHLSFPSPFLFFVRSCPNSLSSF